MSKSKPYITRVTRISIMPEGEPIFSEQCTHVEIEDEADGEFVVVRQQSEHVDGGGQEIQIAPHEWPPLRDAIDELIIDIEKHEKDARKPL